MHNLIQKLFRKRGIEDLNKLEGEEKQIYEEWKAILSKEELTTKDIKEFCQTNLDIIETKWREYDYTDKAKLIPYHTVYKTLLLTIDSPRSARENLEKHLQELINTTND